MSFSIIQKPVGDLLYCLYPCKRPFSFTSLIQNAYRQGCGVNAK